MKALRDDLASWAVVEITLACARCPAVSRITHLASDPSRAATLLDRAQEDRWSVIEDGPLCPVCSKREAASPRRDPPSSSPERPRSVATSTQQAPPADVGAGAAHLSRVPKPAVQAADVIAQLPAIANDWPRTAAEWATEVDLARLSPPDLWHFAVRVCWLGVALIRAASGHLRVPGVVVQTFRSGKPDDPFGFKEEGYAGTQWRVFRVGHRPAPFPPVPGAGAGAAHLPPNVKDPRQADVLAQLAAWARAEFGEGAADHIDSVERWVEVATRLGLFPPGTVGPLARVPWLDLALHWAHSGYLEVPGVRVRMNGDSGRRFYAISQETGD